MAAGGGLPFDLAASLARSGPGLAFGNTQRAQCPASARRRARELIGKAGNFSCDGLARFLAKLHRQPGNRGSSADSSGSNERAACDRRTRGSSAAASRQAEKSTIADLGSAAFMVRLASMAHETQYTKLFRS